MLATDVEWLRFQAVVYSRRRTFAPSGMGEDLAEAWWGPMVAGLTERGLDIGAVRRMSLDQLDALATDGCPEEDPRRMTQADVQAMYDAARAAEAAAAGVATDGEAS
jgi:hypothetical protein